MALRSQQGEIDEDFVFTARLDSVKNLVMLLRAIHFKDHAIIFMTDRGLKVSVEDSKCVQLSAFIQAEVFEEYTLTEEQVVLKINLAILIECLNIFGSHNTALKMSYRKYGFPLTLLLEEDGVVTDCSIRTQEPEEMLDFDIENAHVLNKVIARADNMKDVLTELDSTSEFVEVLLSPDPPYFRLATTGNAGDTKVDISKDSDMIESFNCTTTTVSRYRYSFIKSLLKPLTVSRKVSVRIDDRGLLCLQYMVPADKYTCFIEYFCTPIAEADDD
ncbi:cell cycle checkpoint protein RAD1-like isoform X1 [Schistocerca serialis cubense]|uniref:cell cycle checkpoint protein RAD1-like isoform X1 n=1 Tax=Schistocerca serialis cubense TaxID=2023355 RepID=UPI00214E0398|nr:cell cycle checkpoint protein RAD1-like isoform X1 [Schistocerca serialis cubense]XP_049942136.1 cell cycle checkpoint protein RAD1-like isoform X1 [Schistocerca serialis cubense]